MKRWIRMLFVVLLALGLAAPALAGDVEQNNSEIPGSVLVFPLFERGTLVVGGETLPRSEFNISVTCPAGQVCAEGAGIKLLARWVCPGDQNPRKKFICREVDFELTATVKATVTFGAVQTPEAAGTTSGSTARRRVPAPPCEEGFLIVWVVSPADGNTPRAIKNDALIGHAVVRDGRNDAAAYTAYPIQAVSGLAHDALTDVDGDGRLDFDGISEYKQVTGQVRAAVQLDRTPDPGVRFARASVLTLMTLDIISNRPNYPTFVDLHWFNESEVLLSTSHEFICWSKEELSKFDENLNTSSFGNKALVESTEAEKVAIFGVDDTAGPVTLIGVVLTREFREDDDHISSSYIYGLFNDGRGMTTSFEPN
jgi:hypothetical protein